jgi:hypothetical protein
MTKKSFWGAIIFFLILGSRGHAESIRALIAGSHEVSLENLEGVSLPLSYVSSSVILLSGDLRFFRGVELDLSAPPAYLNYRGSLAIVLYGNLTQVPEPGAADVEGRQLSFEPMPNKIQTVYQIPLRPSHGLKTTPYVSVPTGIIPPDSFPLLFRLMPVIKGISEELEAMVFRLNVKPILSDEGGIRLNVLYPEQMAGKPFTVLIDDTVVENPGEEKLLREGEHHLVILSDDYRNESRRFMVERSKILDLSVSLQDPTPLLVFEAPENALVFLDDQIIQDAGKPCPAEPGSHEVKFQVGDYLVIKSLLVQKGKTYRIALAVDVNISEE